MLELANEEDIERMQKLLDSNGFQTVEYLNKATGQYWKKDVRQ